MQVGNGANMKLVVNMVMGTMMASFAEGLALADKAGLSPEDFIEVCLYLTVQQLSLFGPASCLTTKWYLEAGL